MRREPVPFDHLSGWDHLPSWRDGDRDAALNAFQKLVDFFRSVWPDLIEPARVVPGNGGARRHFEGHFATHHFFGADGAKRGLFCGCYGPYGPVSFGSRLCGELLVLLPKGSQNGQAL